MSAKTITFFSNKGGEGKTFIAANTATALALSKHKVLLLELNFQSAHDIDKILHLPCRYGLVNIMNQIETTDNPELIRKVVVTHSSGLDFLPTILNTSQISHFTPSNIKAFFKMAVGIYDFIIVDAPRAFSEALVTVLQNSNLILLVSTPDELSIHKLQRSLGMLKRTQLPDEMIKLVLNRAASRNATDDETVKQQLGVNVLAHIPSDGKTVGLALNRGVPCVMDSPNSEVSQAIKRLATELEREDIFAEIQGTTNIDISQHMKPAANLWEKLGVSQTGATDMDQKVEIDEEDEETKLKKEIHEKLIQVMNVDHLSPEALQDKQQAQELRKKANTVVNELLKEARPEMAQKEDERKRLALIIVSEAFGLGPLEEFLEDSDISDIMVNSQRQTFIEKKGKLTRTDAKFVSEMQMRSIIDRIIAPLGRRIDESTPMVDARLQDGSRFNAIIPPLSLTGPVITIRKFGRERPTVDDLLNKYQSINLDMRTFLEACVKGRKNIIVSGGTGSGKTTLLNIISTFIPDQERIVTIEDAAELRINKRHWIRLESRPANIEGKGRVPIRTLFMNSLHMRPDRIIVGECRGPEILDMLQAMNTGHDGSMTTLHANSTKDVLVRMSSMILLAGVDLPMRAINEMISTALDIIVHVNRFADGTRKVVEITEVTGLNEDHYLELKDIFLFNQRGTDANGTIMGSYEATGYVPRYYEEFKIMGLDLDPAVFKAKPRAQGSI
ncbi:MAG TPA: ATPase, T2SS/T4P/T4SS family [Candidatus Omnitrophota bacterium]|nr:ATPase, T2SS/T4P/T4SS family [Candidatus Omnitrophota bacterium]